MVTVAVTLGMAILCMGLSCKVISHSDTRTHCLTLILLLDFYFCLLTDFLSRCGGGVTYSTHILNDTTGRRENINLKWYPHASFLAFAFLVAPCRCKERLISLCSCPSIPGPPPPRNMISGADNYFYFIYLFHPNLFFFHIQIFSPFTFQGHFLMFYIILSTQFFSPKFSFTLFNYRHVYLPTGLIPSCW